MKEFVTQIEIGSSPEKIWETLTDFAAFPTWNTFMPVVKGQALLHSRLKIFIKTPGGRKMTLRSILSKIKPGDELRWLETRWGLGFLYSGEHYFRIEQIDERHVKLINGERFSGLLPLLFWKSLKDDFQLGFYEFNKALKEECEN